MKIEEIESFITKVPDFPKPGILFYDVSTLFFSKEAFASSLDHFEKLFSEFKFDTIAAIDARGFIFGSAISLQARKPMIVARKPGKLPGEIFQENYDLEYGSNSLSIEKEALEKFDSYAIVDDLLATGGTVECVTRLINKSGKKISGLLTVVELIELDGRSRFNFPVESILSM